MRFEATVTGVKAIQKKCVDTTWWHDPVVDMLDVARREGEQLARKRAPTLSGRLRTSITSELHATGAAPYALIKAGATAKDGFRYGYALNASKKRYHYRGGTKPTTGWFTKVLGLIRASFRRTERKAAQEIERGWGR